jgi:hypothetical protein
MTTKVFALDTKAGIQRDGTYFDKEFYTDGRWVRFQRGRPRKIGGYRQITGDMNGPSRGMWVNPQNGLNQIFSGSRAKLQQLIIDDKGIGGGVTDMTLSDFTASDLNLWQFDGFYDVAGSGVSVLVAHAGQNLAQIDSTANTPVLSGDINGTTMSKIGVFTESVILNSTTTIAISTLNTLVGAGQSVTGTGIPANTTVVSASLVAPNLSSVAVAGTAGQMTCASTAGLYVGQSVRVSGTLTGTATGITSGVTYYIIATNYTTTFTLSTVAGGSAIVTTAGTTDGLVFTLGQFQSVAISNAATTTSGATTLSFDNNVEVSGGVVSLHPYVFVYGNNGLIKNCAAGNVNDWVSTDANETNVATGKIVQGLPVRGGSNAPSGLFWSLDSLVRVSYIGGAGTPPQYWRYDIISSQSSILSSQSAIEYDGIYYWCGVDRFLMYNGVVKEIPNNMNQNFFFDNLNYNQRQKVWATKVPRFGEIWWYYPRGNSEECNDAIIYNIRENTWYDAGTAIGARRSAGYFSQVFRFPVLADWQTSESVEEYSGTFNVVNGSYFINSDAYVGEIQVGQLIAGTDIPVGTTFVLATATSGAKILNTLVGGTLYTNGTYSNVPLTGGSGGSATANITVSGNAVTSVTLVLAGAGYQVGDVLSADNVNIGTTGSGFTINVSALYGLVIEMSSAATGTATETLTFSTPPDLISVYQHEIGTDEIKGQVQNAIESYFVTSDLGWVAGGPSQPSMAGENVWLHLERVEPDFVQSGDMELYVIGRPFAQSEDETSDPYAFSPNTGKVDMREQRREPRLKFRSNVQGGDYQLGKVIVNADAGDVRPY